MSAEQGKNERALFWWVRVMVNVSMKIYGPGRARRFFEDYQILIGSIRGFRSALRSRGWDVPDDEQERLLGVLVTRCQKYLDSGGELRDVPSYLRKSLHRYVDELADDMNDKFKRVVGRAMLSAEAQAELDKTLLGSALSAIREKWKTEEAV